MACGSCGGRFLEGRGAFEGGLTARLARGLVADAEAMTLRAAARRRGVGWHKIDALVRAWAGTVAEWSAVGCCWSMRPRSAAGAAT